MPNISIVVITWNSQSVLDNCISSLFSHVPAGDFELIVVDNASHDQAYLDGYGNKPNVSVIRNPDNFGYAKAANIGLHKASGEYFLILNPDIVFLSNPFPKLMLEMRNDSQIGVIAPLLVDGDGEPQIMGYYRNFPGPAQFLLCQTPFAKSSLFRSLALRFTHARIGAAGTHGVDQIPGAFLFFRKDLFGSGPALNEDYFIWMEDVDFCRRVHDKGLRVAVTADEKIVHIGGTSFKMRNIFWARPVFVRSYLTYFGIYAGMGSYLIVVSLMALEAGSTILFFPFFRANLGLRGVAARMRLEVKVLKLILRLLIARLKSGPGKPEGR